MRYRCAVLDDYQNVAIKMADWSKSRRRCRGRPCSTSIWRSPDEVHRALKDFHIAVHDARAHAVPPQHHRGAAQPQAASSPPARAMPRSISAAAAERGITVCGTSAYGNPTTGIAFGLMLELTRRIGFEHARLKAGEPWQVTLGPDLEGMTLGIVGLGKLGRRVAGVAKAFGMKVIAWSTEPDGGGMQGGGRRLRHQGGAVPHRRHRHHPPSAQRALARHRGRRRSSA